jgi:O-methyltransferase
VSFPAGGPFPVSLNDAERLRHLVGEARAAAQRDEGDFIEMGVFKGGSAALLAREMKAAGCRHLLHLLDSWEGQPSSIDQDADVEESLRVLGVSSDGARAFFATASEEGVRELLDHLGLLPICRTYRGWVADTLPGISGPFAFAHVDLDFYAPVREALDHLLPRMTPQGVIVVDDYGVEGSRRFPGVEAAVRDAIEGSSWKVEPLGGQIDQSVRLVRG